MGSGSSIPAPVVFANVVATSLATSSIDNLCNTLSALPADARLKLQAALDAAASRENMRLLFDAADADKSGALDGDELLAAITGLGSPDLDADAISALIRMSDFNADGLIQRDEFQELLKWPPLMEESEKPHLVLNFDVNQTIMILDTVIKADPIALLNTILSNCCWGQIIESSTEGEAPTWKLSSSEPSLLAPAEGLKTYLQFAAVLTPLHKDLPLETTKASMARRRALLQSFTREGQPGAALSEHLTRLEAALKIPLEVRAAVEQSLLEKLGLVDGTCLLLPSFLHTLRELKRRGRSFSVCFRTFGKDLLKLAPEFNALCEGTHPIFKAGPLKDDTPIVLNGADGLPDLKMDMTAGSSGCGTWLRTGDSASGGEAGKHLLLVLGSIEQPPLDVVQSGVDAIKRWYCEQIPEGTSVAPPVKVFVGAQAAAQELASRLHVRGRGATLALRDYYPGWEASACSAEGGKPLLLEGADESEVLQIFFDDHINAHDARIVDVRRRAAPSLPALPIGAVFGMHLLRAEPLLSICNNDYFLDAILAAEAKWKLACRRRRALSKALLDKARVLQQIEASKAADSKTYLKYIPHGQTAFVASSPDVSAAEYDELS